MTPIPKATTFCAPKNMILVYPSIHEKNLYDVRVIDQSGFCSKLTCRTQYRKLSILLSTLHPQEKNCTERHRPLNVFVRPCAHRFELRNLVLCLALSSSLHFILSSILFSCKGSSSSFQLYTLAKKKINLHSKADKISKLTVHSQLLQEYFSSLYSIFCK